MLKSSYSQLRERGFLSGDEFLKISSSNSFDPGKYIKSYFPHERTAGYRYIKMFPDVNFLEALCIILENEKPLYSKIELCECIEQFGVSAIEYLDPLIGTIGKNQHKTISSCDLKKKSFPLPRDIVARIIIRLGSEVLYYYKNNLDKYNTRQLSEIIDIIGHITSTSKNEIMESDLLHLFETTSDKLITWKLIKSFQSFTSQKIIEILLCECKNSDGVISSEAERSLKRIHERLSFPD